MALFISVSVTATCVRLKRSYLHHLWLSPMWLGLLSSLASAQIVTDGSLGPMVRLTGTEMTIGAELGRTRGANLYHSFQTFDIPTGHGATFTGPDQIRHVIGRVTGGTASNIDGALRSQVGRADVFLINPAGIAMGPNARVDVPAALHLSTADELRFSDGSRFSARDPSGSSLSLAAPESFGFLSPQPASLAIHGSQLSLQPGRTATLTAGDIAITGTSDGARASLKAPGGTLRLEAVGGAGVVPVSTPSATPGSGTLTFDQAELTTSGDGGGRIALRAGAATLHAAQLLAENQGASAPTGGLDLHIAGALDLDGSWLFSDTTASGGAGDVTIQAGAARLVGSGITSDSWLPSENPEQVVTGAAGTVRMGIADDLWVLDGSEIHSIALSAGPAGAVDLSVGGRLEILNGAQILSNTFAAGDAGGVTITAGSARLEGSGVPGQLTGIASRINPGAGGHAGGVTLNVSGLLEILNGALIDSGTLSSGNAGTVAITAGDLRIAGAGSGQVTGIASHTQSTGDAGTVSIRAGRLRVDGTGSEGVTAITSQASSGSLGGAGRVTVEVADLLELWGGAIIDSSTGGAGNAGTVAVTASDLHIDGAESNQPTGIKSIAAPGSTGDANNLSVTVAGLLELTNGAQINSGTHAEGDSGTITVTTGALRIDGAGSDKLTGIGSQAEPGSTGDAGHVTVDVAGLLELVNGAAISSSTGAEGEAGTVAVTAGALRLDGAGANQPTKIVSAAGPGSIGNAGSVTIRVTDLLELMNGAEINSNTAAVGNAGKVAVTAGELRIDEAGSNWFTGIASQASPESTGNAGSVTIGITGLLKLANGAEINSSTLASGHAGRITVTAGELRIDSGESDQVTGIVSQAEPGSTGNAGSVIVEVTDLLELWGVAIIDSSTYAEGNAGTVAVTAGELRILGAGSNQRTGIASLTQSTGNAGTVSVKAGRLRIDGTGSEGGTTITSSANPGSTGNAGNVIVEVADLLELVGGAQINSGTHAEGDAGAITVTAGALRIDGAGANQVTGIGSQAEHGSTGDAGHVTVDVADLLELLNGAAISSSTVAEGEAGAVAVTAGALRLDGVGANQPARIISGAAFGSTGNAGSLTIRVTDLLELLNGAKISSSTSAEGNAGAIAVTAGELRIDGAGSNWFTGITSQATPESTGNASSVTITVTSLLELAHGAINSSAFASGKAGKVAVTAGNLHILGAGSNHTTGIASQSYSTGDAGTVVVKAGQLRIDGTGSEGATAITTQAFSGSGDASNVIVEVTDILELIGATAIIDSSTYAEGNAGTVAVTAGDLRIDGAGSNQSTGIMTIAGSAATGQVGKIDISANHLTVQNGGSISIEALQAFPAPTESDVQPSICIHSDDLLLTQQGRITTQARATDAGSISIDGGRLRVFDSQITTSVEGSTGDGGNIVLNPDYLILDGGFIQANTTAQGARGGDIRIDTRALIASQGQVQIGGNARQVFVSGRGRNVIQAAAPGGEQGTIAVTAPDLDISASLVPLKTPFVDPEDLILAPCRVDRGAGASSLIERGWGGIPPSPDAPAAVSFDDQRLDRLLLR